MSSISCDTINPKHGNRVTIIAPDYTISDWTTATVTATAGPIQSPSTVDIVVSWKRNGDYVTISTPIFRFAGALATLVFSEIPDLPAPLEATRFPVMNIDVGFLTYNIGCVIVGVDRRLTFFYNIKDGISAFSSGLKDVLPVVFEYKTA